MTPPTAHVKTPGKDTKLMSVILNSTHAIAPQALCNTMLCVPSNAVQRILMLTQKALQHMRRLPLRLAFVKTVQLPSGMYLDSRAGG